MMQSNLKSSMDLFFGGVTYYCSKYVDIKLKNMVELGLTQIFFSK